ncbi:transmembrane protein 145-like isoform X2 [Clavelina lepadiformis]|uniref:transmembrane protein 145-like isoform X2 n=1 Tax=Clavelina lepadiformis TaxID=159417 RepID=UPI0040421057
MPGLKACLFLLCLLYHECCAVYLEGRLHTSQDWAFLGRFCFLSDIGRMQFKFTYPLEECCHNVLLYFDDGKQWPQVYKNDSKNCFLKEAVLESAHNQIINLTTRYSWSGCVVTNHSSQKYLHCEGGRSFRSMRERWWYIAISHCKEALGNNGIDLTYEMKLTNGHSYWTEHFSADECGILETDIFFLILFTMMFGVSIYFAVCLFNRQLFHATYKLFMVCLALEVFGFLTLCVALGTFASAGIENKGLKLIGEVFGAIAELLFLLLLLLLGKGFTITRGKLTYTGTVRMSVFITIYGVIGVVLFLYEYVLFDPGLVLYVYESPAGYGNIALRLTAWVWFTYGIIFTLKRYPEKSDFYYPFYVFYTLWFFAIPIMALVAAYAIPRYMRAKVVNGLQRCIDFAAYSVFLTLTRPSAANSNFPYHVRTSQIGVADTNGRMQSAPNFPHSVYAEPEPDIVENSNAFDLFVVNSNVKNNTVSYMVANGNTENAQCSSRYPKQLMLNPPPYESLTASPKVNS